MAKPAFVCDERNSLDHDVLRKIAECINDREITYPLQFDDL